PLMVASGATVMLAASWVDPLKEVELTVTPPGFVVPVMNHCALAPFLNPLPVMATSRVTVSWGAALGLAESTWIWALMRRVLTAARNTTTQNKTDEQRLNFICKPQ